jgi:predicted  nucleic acid-binding Zn-ribbon protein
VGTKQQNMEVSKKKHSKQYLKKIDAAKKTIKEAEDNMKKMDSEVKDFHNHMQSSMQKLMATF